MHISKKITKMFNGEIICRSEYGKGSNFIFLVALGLGPNAIMSENATSRIRNPLKKNYQKIDVPDKKVF